MTGKPLFIAQTRIPGLRRVTLFEQQWLEHIVTQHVYMIGREKQVEAVVSGATVALAGSSTMGTANPSYVIELNSQIISQSGSPLAVIVDTQSAEIHTAYFNRSLKT
jgi:hypothetical protein